MPSAPEAPMYRAVAAMAAEIFPRQSQDLMDHHSDPPGLQCLHCLVEHCQFIAPPDPGGAFRMDGL